MRDPDNDSAKSTEIELPQQPPVEEPQFDPSRFGAIEIPPELRARLLTVSLPRVPREQLEDTIPPGQTGDDTDRKRPLTIKPPTQVRRPGNSFLAQRWLKLVLAMTAAVFIALALGLWRSR